MIFSLVRFCFFARITSLFFSNDFSSVLLSSWKFCVVLSERIYSVSVSLIGFFMFNGIIGNDFRFLRSNVSVFFVFLVLA